MSPPPVVRTLFGEPAPPTPAPRISSDPPLAGEARVHALAVIQEEVRGCTSCRLGATRRNTVFARGNPFARLCFIGEGPGEQEDKQGSPFVGPAGQLLDKIIGAMGLSPDDVYVANIVKCRPPNNRVPEPDEMRTCTPFLVRQLDLELFATAVFDFSERELASGGAVTARLVLFRAPLALRYQLARTWQIDRAATSQVLTLGADL